MKKNGIELSTTLRRKKKMKRLIVFSTVVAVLFGASLSVFAAGNTVDIVSYMGLKPGQWSIFKHTDSCTANTSQQGRVVVKGQNGQILVKWYNDDGNNWVFDSSDIYRVSLTALYFIGSNDGKDLWAFVPKVTFPLTMKLNVPFLYKGIMKNQRTGEKLPIAAVFMITQKGITVTTETDTFADCIQVQIYTYSNMQARESTVLTAPGRGDVRGWVSKIKNTSEPDEETQNAFKSEIIQFGDSKPPIP